jgi:hypothetical protein
MGGDAQPLGSSDAGSNEGGQNESGPSCRPGTAECDDSTSTVCETPVTFSFRHCGGCGQRCEGSCISGTCKPAELILDRNVSDFVADARHGFALVSGDGFSDLLYRIDLYDGSAQIIAQGLEFFGRLVLGADRLFVAYSDRVLSLGLDGSGLTVENFEPETFGATQAGVYYTSYDWEKQPNEQCSLWFRATGTSTFELVLQSRACAIFGSSRDWVLVEREQDDQDGLLLIGGGEVMSLGPAPEEPWAPWSEPEVVEDGAIFLLEDAQAASGYEVLWLALNREPQRFAVEASLEQATFVLAPGGVGLLLDERGNTFVRLFSGSNLDEVPLGISNNSTLLYVDDRYLWYNWYGAANDLDRFMRARQLQLSDAAPGG